MKTLILIFSLYNCKSPNFNKYNNYDTLRCVEVRFAYPAFDRHGKILNYDTAIIHVYYYKNMNMYRLEYWFVSSHNDALLLSELRHHFFIYTTGDPYGIDYDKNKTTSPKKVLVDSVFSAEWVVHNNAYPMFILNTTHLLYTKLNKKSGILEEQYIFRGIEDTSINGICFLSFMDKLKGINVSLSKELDSIKNMKLFRVKRITNPRRLTDSIYLERIEETYHLSEIPITNREEIMNYFEMYKKDMQTLK